MKPIVMLPLSLGLGIASVIGAAYATSFLVTDYTPHHFAHMDAPLWTDRPVLVDTDKQALERLPALVAAADIPAQDHPLGDSMVAFAGTPMPQDDTAKGNSAADPDAGMDMADADLVSGQPTPSAQDTASGLGAAHVDWCFARYRSYRVEDNSYQPFDAAERRQCQSPQDDTAALSQVSDADEVAGTEDKGAIVSDRGAAPPQEPQMVAASAGGDAAWCFSQYRSYRAEDNSYQPFDGGPRRQCAPRTASY